MRISRTNGYITLRDRVGPFWLLGGFLLTGGVVAVAMPLGLATNAGNLTRWERLASLGIGLGGIATTVWWLMRSPATTVHVDLARRRVRLRRFGLAGRQVRDFTFDELNAVEVEQGSDGEGGSVWRPVVHLRTGERVSLSELWSHDRAGIEESVVVLADTLGTAVMKAEAAH